MVASKSSCYRPYPTPFYLPSLGYLSQLSLSGPVACDQIVEVLSATSETARPSMMMMGWNLIFDALAVRLDFELTSEMRSVVGLYLRTAEIWARWDGATEVLPWWIQSQIPLDLLAQVFSGVEML
jgi:hypothetical protein